MGTQAATARTILDKRADYLFALQDNRPRLAEDLRLFFADPGPGRLDTHETRDLDNDRSEIRRHVVLPRHRLAHLGAPPSGRTRFPGLKAIAMVEARVGRGEATSVERRYFLSSAPLDAPLFARAMRAHGGYRPSTDSE